MNNLIIYFLLSFVTFFAINILLYWVKTSKKNVNIIIKTFEYFINIEFFLSLTFILIFFYIFNIQVPYWYIIIFWGIFNILLSYVKITKLIKFTLYILSFIIISLGTGLHFTFSSSLIINGVCTTFFFLFMIYFFSFLSDLKGLSNIIFFSIALSLLIFLKFIYRVDLEILRLNTIFLAFSFAILILEFMEKLPFSKKEFSFRIKRTDGKLIGFVLSIIILYSPQNNHLINIVIIPFVLVLLLLMFQINLKKYLKKSHLDYIYTYDRTEFILFIFILFFSAIGFFILLQSFNLPYGEILIIDFTLFIFEYLLLSLLLTKKKIRVQYNLSKINIFNIPIDNLTMEETIDKLYKAIKNKKRHFIITINPIILLNALENKKMMKAVHNATLIIPDGIGIYYASILLGTPLKERVPGIEIVEYILENPPMNNMKVLLFGANQGYTRKIEEKIKKINPNLDITYYHGYSDPNEREKIKLEVREGKYDLILVALGSPKQELWINREFEHIKKHNKSGVFIGVGGSFDVIAGKKKRAPEKWRQLGLEWLYRIGKDFKRFPLFLKLFDFTLKVLIESIENN